MSQGVNRLKELLFEPETQRLTEVQSRLDALDAHDRELVAKQSEFARRLDAVFEQAGTKARLQTSVATVIDGVLRDAEQSKHEELSQAMAPLVVRTIKTELRNSQDEMVEALYPITGKLVKQYVQAAVADMMADINRRLGGGQKLSDLEARAKAQGVTVAELVLAETQALKVDELFLIRRGAGDLVAHWERTPEGDLRNAAPGSAPGNNRDALIAGYLSGIASFSEEAFDEKKGVLRALELNGERIFVRASPVYLLAARCSGSAPVAVEQIIDDEFVRVLTAYKQALEAPSPRNGAAAVPDVINTLLPELAGSFESRFEDKRKEIEARAAAPAGKPSFGRLYMFGGAVLLPIIGWALWSMYEAAQTVRTKTAVQAILGSASELNGYPISLEVERGGGSYRLSGLVPSAALKDRLNQRLEAELPWTRGRNDLAVLPQSGTVRDPEPDIAALRRDLAGVGNDVAVAAMRRALDRADNRITRLNADISGLASRLPAGADQGRAARAGEELKAASTALAAIKQKTASATADVQAEAQALIGLRRRIAAAEQNLAALANLATDTAPPATTDAVVLAEDVASTLERLGAQVPLIERTLAVGPLQQQVVDLRTRLDGLKIPAMTARERLDGWARANAVFFLNGTDFRDDAGTIRALDELTRLLSDTREVIRIIGYTDERGGQSAANVALGNARAERVAVLLADRGVPRDRLIVLSRPNGNDIARQAGPGTANRRVEFEVGFVNEPVAR